MLRANLVNPKLRRLILPILIIVVLLSVVNFTFEYGVKLANEQKTVDFPSFYWASDALFNHNVSPYDFTYLQSKTEKKIFPFLYPPPSTLLFYPLSLFEYKDALIIYTIINHSSILISIILIVKLFNFKYFSIQLLLLTFVIYTSYPSIENMYSGQVSNIVLILLLLFIILRDKLQTLGCFALALAIILKMYPIVVLPVLLLTKNYRLFARTTLLLIFITLSSLLIIPDFVWKDWLFNIVPTGGYGEYPIGLTDVHLFDNKGVNGVFAELLIKQDSSRISTYPVAAKVATYIICIFLTLVTFFVTYKYINQHDRDAIQKIIFVTMPLIFLIAPFSWTHHSITLYPTILYLMVVYCQSSMLKLDFRLILLLLGIVVIFKVSGVLEVFGVVLMLWLMMLDVIIKQRSLVPTENQPQTLEVAATAH